MDKLTIAFNVIEIAVAVIGFGTIIFKLGEFHSSHTSLKESFDKHVEDDDTNFRSMQRTIIDLLQKP